MTYLVPSAFTTDAPNTNVADRTDKDIADFYANNAFGNPSVATSFDAGAYADNLPTSPSNPAARNYNLNAPMFGASFYNQLWVEPNRIDVGNVTTDQTRVVNIWNSYFNALQLISVNVVGDPDITLIGGSAPYTFKALEEQNYTFKIGLDGPAIIAAAIVLQFDIATYTIFISGARSVAWSPQPIETITEKLGWVTNVITSYSGKEQRIRIRQSGPTQEVSMSYHIRDGNRITKNLAIQGWMPQTWSMPVWFEGSWDFGTTLPIGTTTIITDTTRSDFRVGGTVMLFQDENTFEVSEIAAITPTQIDLTFPTSVEIQNPYYIPVRNAIMKKNASREVFANQAALNRFDLTFKVKDLQLLTGTIMYPEFRDLYVLESQPLRTPIVGDTYENDYDVFENTTGSINTLPKWEVTKYDRPVSFRMLTTTFWDMRIFLHYISGQLIPFFLPTFEDDFRLAEDLTTNASSFVIVRTGYFDFWLQSPFKYLRTELKDGTIYYSKITNVSITLSGNEEITITPTLGNLAPIPQDDIRTISLMTCARLSSDNLEFSHNSSGYTEFSLPVKGIDYDA